MLPRLELGGAERQAMHFAKYLKGIGTHVVVWGHPPAGGVSSSCDEMAIPWEEKPTLWPCRKINLYRIPLRFLHWVRALRKLNPDIILPYCPHPCVSAGLTWRYSKAQALIWGQRNSDDLGGDWVEKRAYRNASAVICNAEHELNYLDQTLGETTAPRFVVHNGLDLPQPELGRKEWRSRLGVPEASQLVVMLANFRSAQKDHETLLYAWKQVICKKQWRSNHPFLVLPGVNHSGLDEIKQLSTTLEVQDSVVFPGPVDDVAGLLQACDIGTLITNYEGLPNALLEYMLSGLPTVVSDLPSTREVLKGDPEQPLCRPKNADDVAANLLAFLDDGELAKKVGIRNRQKAVAEYSIEKMCKSMNDVVEEVWSRVSNK